MRAIDRNTSRAEAPRHLIVIGASAGGIQALREVVSALPVDIDAAILVALHMAATARTVLPMLLERAGRLPATLAADVQLPERGRILVAPPDHHLLVDERVVRLSTGPRVAGQRPSIDELFRSAARSLGGRTIAVVLSGTLDDGTAGALAVRRAGGTVVVQDPAEAAFPDMPANVIRAVVPDHVLPARAIGVLLAHLAAPLAPNDGFGREASALDSKPGASPIGRS